MTNKDFIDKHRLQSIRMPSLGPSAVIAVSRHLVVANYGRNQRALSASPSRLADSSRDIELSASRLSHYRDSTHYRVLYRAISL